MASKKKAAARTIPSFRGAIDARIAALGDVIEVVSYAPGKATPKKTIERAEASIGAPLPPVLRAFYEECNGLSLEWAHNDSAARGRITVSPLEQMFGGYEGLKRKVWDDTAFRNDLWLDDFEGDLDKKVFATFKKLRVLERWQDSPPMCITFKLKEPQQIYIVERWNLHRFPLTIERYFDALIDCLGLQDWTYVLAPGIFASTQKEFQRDYLAIFGGPPAASSPFVKVVPSAGSKSAKPAKTSSSSASAASAPTKKEVGARVFIDQRLAVRHMQNARGTIRTIEGTMALVELDIGLVGWAEMRRLKLLEHDELEKLRDGRTLPAFQRHLTDASKAMKLIKTIVNDIKHTTYGIPVEPRPDWKPNMAGSKLPGIYESSPHLLGLVRALPDHEGAEVLITTIEVLFEGGTGLGNASSDREAAINIVFGALALLVLSERERDVEEAVTAKNKLTKLANRWPASLVDRLSAVIAQSKKLASGSDIPWAVAFLASAMQRISIRANEFLRGANWEKDKATRLGLEAHPVLAHRVIDG